MSKIPTAPELARYSPGKDPTLPLGMEITDWELTFIGILGPLPSVCVFVDMDLMTFLKATKMLISKMATQTSPESNPLSKLTSKSMSSQNP